MIIKTDLHAGQMTSDLRGQADQLATSAAGLLSNAASNPNQASEMASQAFAGLDPNALAALAGLASNPAVQQQGQQVLEQALPGLKSSFGF